MNEFTAENWYDVGITYDDPDKITKCLHKAVNLDPLCVTAPNTTAADQIAQNPFK